MTSLVFGRNIGLEQFLVSSHLNEVARLATMRSSANAEFKGRGAVVLSRMEIQA